MKGYCSTVFDVPKGSEGPCNMKIDSSSVMPAKAGIQYFSDTLDSRLRGNDNQGNKNIEGKEKVISGTHRQRGC
jgi:hypothetical protein